jgi:hypothetical protein
LVRQVSQAYAVPAIMRQICPPHLLVLLAILFSAQAHAVCRVEPMSTVPVDIVDGHILVTVQVNEVAETFVLDTGAERTLMGEEVVRHLGLQRDGWVASTILGLGGYQQRPNAHPRSLRLGNSPLHRRTLTGDTSVTVGPLPVTEIRGRSVAGLLGRDFLSPFDLDLDLPEGLLALYEVHNCDARFLPWTMPYFAIPASTLTGAALVVQVWVEGRPLRTLIDSGASSSLITAPGMFRLGLTPASLAKDPGGNGVGVGPEPVPMRRHRFGELRVGPDTMRDVPLWVAPVRVVPIVDLLLGADWLRTRHVWLSFATKQIFVAVR